MLVLDEDYPQAMPFKDTSTNPAEFDNPSDYHLTLGPVLKEHKGLFKLQLGRIHIAEHAIDTGDAPPVKVPPRPIPFQYQDHVHKQL